jgi:acyl-homoserine-lactone acylase
MKNFRVCLGLLVLSAPMSARAAVHKTEILRDEYGVPHIFGASAADAAYGAGYAQAEDRLEELLKNYRIAEGSMAEVFGESWYEHDYRQRLWRHRAVSEQNYAKLPAHIRAVAESFQDGVRRYMKEHPGEAPAWAPKLEPWQVIALGRYIIWGWMEGEVAADLRRAGIAPDPQAYRGSNEMLIAPRRTAMGAPIAVIDPHLSWYGEFRFYEMRIYGGELNVSGAAILGVPFPSLGHSRWASVAMTTGGPDTSDAYEEEVANGKYKFQGEWLPLEVREERIGVKRGDTVEWKTVRFESTRHGPIVAHKDGKAYSGAIPYADQFRLTEQTWNVMTARNLSEVKKALGMLQLMPQNVMVGTVDGDIYYLRNGRVPVRPAGCDPSKPMAGSTGACEWHGIHPLEDLVQIANPPQGYMQNCNISPEWLMKNSPLTPDRWKDSFYLYNAPPGPAHQRAAMMLDLLDAARDVSVEQAIGIAFSPQVYKAETWQERIRKAAPDVEDDFTRVLLTWDRRSEAGSRAALGFYLFKMALGDASKEAEPPASLTDAQINAAVTQARERLASQFAPDATYGSYFRVGRKNAKATYPVSGGTLRDAGMATPRAVNFAKQGDLMVGAGGQTSTQIVFLTKPPQSYMVIPLGESDHPDSPHFDDQARKLFSVSRAKPTYFLNRKELEKHVTRTKELAW